MIFVMSAAGEVHVSTHDIEWRDTLGLICVPHGPTHQHIWVDGVHESIYMGAVLDQDSSKLIPHPVTDYDFAMHFVGQTEAGTDITVAVHYSSDHESRNK